MQQVKWTERKFLFGYDRSYVPFFLERLRGTAPRLAELVGDCDEAFASLDTHGWTIKQHIGHLTDLEKLHDGRVDDFLEGMAILRPADMTNKETNEAGHNNRSIDTLLSEFRNTRDAYVDRIEQLDADYYDARALHPRLKQQVSLADLLYFVAEHDNNHLTKVAMIVRSK